MGKIQHIELGHLADSFVHNGIKCNVFVPAIDYYEEKHVVSEKFARDIVSIYEKRPELRVDKNSKIS